MPRYPRYPRDEAEQVATLVGVNTLTDLDPVLHNIAERYNVVT